MRFLGVSVRPSFFGAFSGRFSPPVFFRVFFYHSARVARCDDVRRKTSICDYRNFTYTVGFAIISPLRFFLPFSPTPFSFLIVISFPFLPFPPVRSVYRNVKTAPANFFAGAVSLNRLSVQFHPLRQAMPRRTVDFVPLRTRKRYVRGFAYFGQVCGIHRSRDKLHTRRVAQYPRRRDSRLG